MLFKLKGKTTSSFSHQDSGSDRYVLSCPSVDLAWRLLDGPLLAAISKDHQLAPRLAQALAICAQMPALCKFLKYFLKRLKTL